MSRVYISFKSDIKRIDSEKFGVSVSYLVFKTAKGEVILSPANYSDNSLNDAGDFNCTWRGVTYLDGDEDVALDDETFSTIKGTGVIDAIGIDLGESAEINGNTIKISDVRIAIDHGNYERFALESDGSDISIELV